MHSHSLASILHHVAAYFFLFICFSYGCLEQTNVAYSADDSKVPADWRINRSLAALSTKDPEIIALAIRRLVRLANDDAPISADILIDRWKQPDSRNSDPVRNALAIALGKLRSTNNTHLDVLIELLADPHLSACSAESLAANGPIAIRAVDSLIKAIEVKSSDFVIQTPHSNIGFLTNNDFHKLSSEVFKALGEIGVDDSQHLSRLLALVLATDPRLDQLPSAFRRVSPKLRQKAANRLLDVATDKIMMLERINALNCLAQLGYWDQHIRDSLLKLLNDDSMLVDVRGSAAFALGKLTIDADAQIVIESLASILEHLDYGTFPVLDRTNHEAACAVSEIAYRFPRLLGIVNRRREKANQSPGAAIQGLYFADREPYRLRINPGNINYALAQLMSRDPETRLRFLEHFRSMKNQARNCVVAIRGLSLVSADDKKADGFAEEVATILLRGTNEATSMQGFEWDIVDALETLPTALTERLGTRLRSKDITPQELATCARLIRLSIQRGTVVYAPSDIQVRLAQFNGSHGVHDTAEADLRYVSCISATTLESALLQASALSLERDRGFGVTTKVLAIEHLGRIWKQSPSSDTLRARGIDVHALTYQVIDEAATLLQRSRLPNQYGQDELVVDFDLWSALDLLGPLPLTAGLDILERRYRDPQNESVYTFWAIAATSDDVVDLATVHPWIHTDPVDIPRDDINISRKIATDLTHIVEHSRRGGRLNTYVLDRLMTVVDRAPWSDADIQTLDSLSSRLSTGHPEQSKVIARKRSSLLKWYQDWKLLFCIVVIVIAVYVFLCIVLYFFMPLALVKFSSSVSAETLVNALNEYKRAQTLLKVMIAYLGPSVFARLSKPRTAWANVYRTAGARVSFDELESSVQSEYLKQPDVISAWASAYGEGHRSVAEIPAPARHRFFRDASVVKAWASRCRNGESRWDDIPADVANDFFRDEQVVGAWAWCCRQGKEEWSDVPEIARQVFLKDDNVLDNWVAFHIPAARTSLQRLADERQRPLDGYVPLPVAIDGNSPEIPSPATFRHVFQMNRASVLICGEGGAGKTSLAFRLAQSAMSERPEDNLFGYPAIPIVLESIATGASLVSSVQMCLRSSAHIEQPIAEDLTRALLERRRLFVVIDGLTEMNVTARTFLLDELSKHDSPLNAIVITSRQRKAIEPFPVCNVFWPQPIAPDRIGRFLDALLRMSGIDFNDDKLDVLRRGLRELAHERAITPLLVKLYADSAIEALQSSDMVRLPRSVPELMLAYVNELNRSEAHRDLQVQRDAKCVAWAMLRKTFRPIMISRDSAIKALDLASNDGAETRLIDLIERLRLIRIVGEARNRVQFGLDPLSEYLAAIHVFEKHGTKKEPWSRLLKRVDNLPGGPAASRGFLQALSDVLMAADGLIDINMSSGFLEFMRLELAERLAAL